MDLLEDRLRDDDDAFSLFALDGGQWSSLSHGKIKALHTHLFRM
jgi:hypothetical protein